MPWIRSLFPGALRFHYLAGDRGRRPGAFDSGTITMEGGCFVGAPDRGGYWLERQRGRTEILPGGIALVPPGQAFRMRWREPAGMTQHWCLVDVRLFDVLSLFTLLPLPAQLAGIRGAAAAPLVARLNAAAAACDHLDPLALARREAIGFRLVEALIADAPPPPRLAERLHAIVRVQPVLQLMEQQLGERLTRGQLARVLGLSEGRLHLVFAAAMGLAPGAYLARLRLRRAQELLSASDAPVGRIGAQVGYPDPFHFSRRFSQAFGISPTAFRARARGL